MNTLLGNLNFTGVIYYTLCKIRYHFEYKLHLVLPIHYPIW